MEYCSGSDLSIYIKNRGKIHSLDFIPRNSRDGQKVFWPHPPVGGLDERVTRHFLGQLCKTMFNYQSTLMKLIAQRWRYGSCGVRT